MLKKAQQDIAECVLIQDSHGEYAGWRLAYSLMGKIIYGNPAGQSIWTGARYVGIEDPNEYKGWWLSTGKPIEPDDWAVARAISKGETSLNEEIEIECFDGSHKFILNSAIPVRDDRGKILWAFVVNQDITTQKQREQELIRNNELLERFLPVLARTSLTWTGISISSGSMRLTPLQRDIPRSSFPVKITLICIRIQRTRLSSGVSWKLASLTAYYRSHLSI